MIIREHNVEWRMDRDRICGRSKLASKIIFPKRGEEAACCFKQGHSQKCELIRDTKPDDHYSGALIVTIKEECQFCLNEKNVLKDFPGWKIDDKGYLVAPDGVGGCSAAAKDYFKKTKNEFQRRELMRNAIKICTEEFIEEAKKLPYPENEPELKKGITFTEPEKWVAVSVFLYNNKELLNDPLWKEFEKFINGKSRAAINMDGSFGCVVTTETWEYLSDDEMGYRTGGGNDVFHTDESYVYDEKFKPQVAHIAEKLKNDIESRDVRYAQYVKDRIEWKKTLRDWWLWWQNLNIAQKVRVLLTASNGGFCNLKLVNSNVVLQGQKIHKVVGINEYKKYISPAFKCRLENSISDGSFIFQFSDISNDITLEECLSVTDFHHRSSSVMKQDFLNFPY